MDWAKVWDSLLMVVNQVFIIFLTALLFTIKNQVAKIDVEKWVNSRKSGSDAAKVSAINEIIVNGHAYAEAEGYKLNLSSDEKKEVAFQYVKRMLASHGFEGDITDQDIYDKLQAIWARNNIDKIVQPSTENTQHVEGFKPTV